MLVVDSLTLGGPSIFGKMGCDHFVPVTGNKIIHLQARTQPREYCGKRS